MAGQEEIPSLALVSLMELSTTPKISFTLFAKNHIIHTYILDSIVSNGKQVRVWSIWDYFIHAIYM